MKLMKILFVILVIALVLIFCVDIEIGKAAEKNSYFEVYLPVVFKPCDGACPTEQPADEQPADEQPADEQPADEQPADEQPADEQPADEQPAEDCKQGKYATCRWRVNTEGNPPSPVPPNGKNK